MGDQIITRAELKRTMQANDRALSQIATQVGKGVRRRQAGETRAVSKVAGGLSKPNLYSQELVSFLCSANLGKVDPSNPKSEDLAAVLKRSPFGKHGIATTHTVSRLISVLVSVNGFKDKTNGQNINFPAGYLEKALPNAIAALTAAGKPVTNWTYINLSSLSAVCMTKKAALDAKQSELLAQQSEAVSSLSTFLSDVLNKHKDASAPTPVVPAAFAAPVAASRQRSPARAKN